MPLLFRFMLLLLPPACFKATEVILRVHAARCMTHLSDGDGHACFKSSHLATRWAMGRSSSKCKAASREWSAERAAVSGSRSERGSGRRKDRGLELGGARCSFMSSLERTYLLQLLQLLERRWW